MRTLTFFEYVILQHIISKYAIPVNKQTIAAIKRLSDLKLIKGETGEFVPVTGSSYTYRGHTYTIQ
jgi:RIO-like serine/threonine protein kinase